LRRRPFDENGDRAGVSRDRRFGQAGLGNTEWEQGRVTGVVVKAERNRLWQGHGQDDRGDQYVEAAFGHHISQNTRILGGEVL